MGDADNDDAFLARLNALKSTTFSLHHDQNLLPPLTSESQDTPDDLIARFAKIQRGRATVDASATIAHDEGAEDYRAASPTIEELLAELKHAEHEVKGDGSGDNAEDLISEAKKALADSKLDEEDSRLGSQRDADETIDADKATSGQGHTLGRDELKKGIELESDAKTALPRAKKEPSAPAGDPTQAERDESSNHADEDAEADAALERILNELQVDHSTPLHQPEQPNQASPTRPSNHDDAAALPSDPSAFPDVPQDFALPTAPTTNPVKEQAKYLPKKEEDVETWCEICLADAAVRCIGCDGELYCWTCWREGHTGESAGYEERAHKWERYAKGHARKPG